MVIPEEGCMLRIFIGESDHHDGRPPCDWLVLQARERGLAGATVLRGIEGLVTLEPVHVRFYRGGAMV